MSGWAVMVGDKFGYLECIAADAGRTRGRAGSVLSEFRCVCGRTVIRSGSAVKYRASKGGRPSCGSDECIYLRLKGQIRPYGNGCIV